MDNINVVENKTSDLVVLHELTRKELIADLIMDTLFNAIYLDSRNKPNFNSYDIKDGLLLDLMEKYDAKRYEKVIAKLKEEAKDG